MSDNEYLNQAIDNAKKFENFSNVLMAISLHPEWLTLIPDGRRWSILHQIIFSGNVNHLDQLLALEKSNTEFRLSVNTNDNQTILDVAKSRPDKPEMITHIQKLLTLDEMLNYAKGGRWNECYNLVKENPRLVNEKPPYRRYYLIHHMAFVNETEQFERFSQIKGCIFDSTVRADKKKINIIAREQNQIEFAQLLEKIYPNLLDKDDLDIDSAYKPTEEAAQKTQVLNLTVNQSFPKDLDDDLMGKKFIPKTRDEVVKYLATTQSNQLKTQSQTNNAISQNKENDRKLRVMDNLTCPLTLAVFIDPVIASDGFTYERSAIIKWLEKNERSPMTNQLLPNKDLSPNIVVKQIIAVLQPKS